jgi:heterodisulfide reductase subunit A-like polyferredoxin
MDQNTTNGAVMVVGGGTAGMQAALDLANSGFLVKLVEKSSAFGGVMWMTRWPNTPRACRGWSVCGGKPLHM